MNVSPLLGAATPERPGPGPLPLELLHALELEVGRRLSGLLAGEYRSSHYGDGVELAQVRPYVPGDDVRRIEWNVTARTGEPHVRVTIAERQHAEEALTFLADASTKLAALADRQSALQ